MPSLLGFLSHFLDARELASESGSFCGMHLSFLICSQTHLLGSDYVPVPPFQDVQKCYHGAVSHWGKPRRLEGTLAYCLTAEGLRQTYTCAMLPSVQERVRNVLPICLPLGSRDLELLHAFCLRLQCFRVRYGIQRKRWVMDLVFRDGHCLLFLGCPRIAVPLWNASMQTVCENCFSSNCPDCLQLKHG